MRRAGAAVVALGLAFALGHPGLSQTRGLEIRTLSSRPDLVSGGDALIEVVAPSGASGSLTLTANGRDVSSAVTRDAQTGTYRGVVSGLAVGRNQLQATLGNASHSLTVTNHPITGPILSGPHLTPYECNTVQSGLGEPLDANCSAPRKVWYIYRAADNAFKELTDPAGARPADLTDTTTNDGRMVPYIVRVEAGTINRAIYQIAILDNPTAASLNAETWRPGPAWNRKLVVSFGGGSGTQYVQGTVAPPVGGSGRGAAAGGGAVSHEVLSAGFAHLVSSELVNGRRGNAVLQGETLMMIKEYIIERYGAPKWTTGNGGSGGAIQQLVITQLYPGLLDGLMPSLSFPDSTLHTIDSILLTNLWPKLDAATWTEDKKTAVEGFTPGTAAAWNRAYGRLGVPTNAGGCALTDRSLIYHPVNNPKGARCTTQDIRANIYGRDPQTGFALRPTDNVGIQYGLAALNSGAISVDEFLDVNEKIGGTSLEGDVVPQRAEGNRQALRALYESGLVASYSDAHSVPIILSRTYTDSRGDIHDRQRDFVIRARLQKVNGRSDNAVIWLAGNQRAGYSTLTTMNRWLDAITADPAPLTIEKVVTHKPAEAVDTCWDMEGNKIVEPAVFDNPNTRCNTLYPVHSEPRLVAGAPLTNDVMKCQLRGINFADYKPAFTDAQKARMHAIFPGGVCDFSKPGVEQVKFKGGYQKY